MNAKLERDRALRNFCQEVLTKELEKEESQMLAAKSDAMKDGTENKALRDFYKEVLSKKLDGEEALSSASKPEVVNLEDETTSEKKETIQNVTYTEEEAANIAKALTECIDPSPSSADCPPKGKMVSPPGTPDLSTSFIKGRMSCSPQKRK